MVCIVFTRLRRDYKTDLHLAHDEGFYTFLTLTRGHISTHLSEMIVLTPDTTVMPGFEIPRVNTLNFIPANS